ncbi:hypothetical protein EPO15_11500 [bacterium]|nr:MAG: hypothetical protein EPO15_11500 [bacterium]
MTGALLLALAAAARAEPSACALAYRPEYSVDWEITQSAWNAYCAKGYDAGDALRQSQRDALARCVARFSPYEAKQKIPPGEAAALCAQGADGRARLAERTGDRPKPVVAKTTPAPPRKPGASKMGPFGRALEVAQSWRPDACFSGLYYVSIESVFIPIAEWEAARTAHRAPNKEKTQLEEYAYYFHSPSDAVNAYRVSFGDNLDTAFCYKVDRLDGPDHTDTALVQGLDACLSGAQVDLPGAIDVAAKNGWRMDLPFKAYLVQVPAGFFQRACRSATRNNAPVRCDELDAWDPAKLRRVTGAPVWVLTAAGQTAFVDAVKGRFRYLAPGGVDFKAAKSFKYAEPCSEDKKGGGAFNQQGE